MRFATHNLITNQNLSVSVQARPTVLQNLHAMFVTPVMDDVLHDVSIRAGRNAFKEIAPLCGDLAFVTLE